MKPNDKISARNLAAIGVAAAALTSLACTFRPARSEPHVNEITGYQPYQNDTVGFGFAQPKGWTVRTNDTLIFVESPDKSEYIIVQAFDANPGETSELHLQSLGDKFDSLFAQAKIDSITEIKDKGSEALGALHYQGPGGPEQVRALCSIIGGKSLLYIIAAPEDRFETERPKLVKVVGTLAFTHPTIRQGAHTAGPAKEAFVDDVIDRALYPLTRKTSKPSNGAYYTTATISNEAAYFPRIDFSPLNH